MNMEFIIANASQLLVVVAVICTLISVITEFTKEIGILNRIPTSLQVLILSIIICVTAFFAYISYAKITFVWYYLVAVIFASFIVAIVCCKGWEYLITIGKGSISRRINENDDYGLHNHCNFRIRSRNDFALQSDV